MKLPNASRALIPVEKVRDYLLNPEHRTGGLKHTFFQAFGFTRTNWERFADALRRHAAGHDVEGQEKTAFGALFRVRGPLHAPDGRSPQVRSVWFVDHGGTDPRLVTAYPVPQSRA